MNSPCTHWVIDPSPPVRVVFGVQVDVSQGIREEVSPFDHLFADSHILMNVPPDGDERKSNSLGLPDAGFEGRKFVFPCGDGDRLELLA